jgi:hypothetical protein
MKLVNPSDLCWTRKYLRGQWIEQAKLNYRKLLTALIMMVLQSASWAATQAFLLLDDATGKPYLTLPTGEPELFMSPLGLKGADYVGYSSNHKVVLEPLTAKEMQIPFQYGARRKLEGKNRWIRIEKWCCDEFNVNNPNKHQNWDQVHNKLNAQSDKVGHLSILEFSGTVEAVSCLPFSFAPTFILDPITHQPKWIKYFAVARIGDDNNYKFCERDEWTINAFARTGSRLDSKSLLVEAGDANGMSHILQVSIETGEILSPLPTDFKVIDAEDVERFKNQFIQRHTCPSFTPEEAKRADRFRKTATGRCIIARRLLYEESILRHFMGEPKPKIEVSFTPINPK